MSHVTITLHHYENGTLDCWVQEEGGATVSFDPLQLPAKMKKAMGDALVNALSAKTAAEERATVADTRAKEAEAKVESVAGLLATQELLEAKDATAQALLAQVADLEAALAAKG